MARSYVRQKGAGCELICTTMVVSEKRDASAWIQAVRVARLSATKTETAGSRRARKRSIYPLLEDNMLLYYTYLYFSFKNAYEPSMPASAVWAILTQETSACREDMMRHQAGAVRIHGRSESGARETLL